MHAMIANNNIVDSVVSSSSDTSSYFQTYSMKAMVRQRRERQVRTNDWLSSFVVPYMRFMLGMVLCWMIGNEIRIVHANTAAGTNTLIGIVGDGFVVLAADTLVDGGDIVMKASGVDKITILREDHMAMMMAVAGNMADADHVVTMIQTMCRIHAYQNSVPRDVHVIDCNPKLDFRKTKPPAIISEWKEDDDDDILSVESIAHAARNQIARRMNVCALIAGMMHQEEDDEANSFIFSRKSSHTIADPVHRQLRAATTTSTSLSSLSSASDLTIQPNRMIHENKKIPALYWLDEYGSLQKVLYGAHGYASSLLWSVLDRGYRHDHMSLEEVLQLLDECLTALRTRYVINTQPLLSTTTTSESNTIHTASSRFCIKCIDANGCRVITR